MWEYVDRIRLLMDCDPGGGGAFTSFVNAVERRQRLHQFCVSWSVPVGRRGGRKDSQTLVLTYLLRPHIAPVYKNRDETYSEPKSS
jgi:hypothetical protein